MVFIFCIALFIGDQFLNYDSTYSLKKNRVVELENNYKKIALIKYEKSIHNNLAFVHSSELDSFCNKDFVLNITAILVAQSLQTKTLNGYAGSCRANSCRFIYQPNMLTLRNNMGINNLDPTKTCIVVVPSSSAYGCD